MGHHRYIVVTTQVTVVDSATPPPNAIPELITGSEAAQIQVDAQASAEKDMKIKSQGSKNYKIIKNP